MNLTHKSQESDNNQTISFARSDNYIKLILFNILWDHSYHFTRVGIHIWSHMLEFAVKTRYSPCKSPFFAVVHGEMADQNQTWAYQGHTYHLYRLNKNWADELVAQQNNTPLKLLNWAHFQWNQHFFPVVRWQIKTRPEHTKAICIKYLGFIIPEQMS